MSPNPLNRHKRKSITQAFYTYLDGLEEALIEMGLEEAVACDLIFASADKCTEKDQLPPFPASESDHLGMGEWVVRAQDVEFHGFVVKLAERLNG